jgi:hypothetical protein
MGRDLDDIFTPLEPGNLTLSALPPRRWSLTTLMAARPNPKYDTRTRAEAWNREYAKEPQLLVNPADFPDNHPEPTPEQVERNWDRLKRLSDEFKL